MGKIVYCFNSIKSMLNALYPEQGENYDDFYSMEALTNKLDYIINNMDKILNKSDEEYKRFLYYILSIRIKELYIKTGEYSKALNCNKKGISKIFNDIINGTYTIENPNDIIIPSAIIEAFLRLKITDKLDEEIYQVLRLLCSESLNLIKSVPSSYLIYLNDEINFEVGYDDENLLEVMVGFCESIIEHEDFDILDHMLLYTFNLLVEVCDCCIVDSNIDKMSLKLNSLLERLQKCCLDRTDAIAKAFALFKSYCDIIIKMEKDNEGNLFKKKEFTDVTINFSKFIQALNDKQCKNYAMELSKIIHAFCGFYTYIEDEDRLYFMETILELKDKPNLPKYKKVLIEDNLLNTCYVGDLFELNQFRKITEIYYKVKDVESIKRYAFEYAYSLAECGDAPEAEKLYLNMIDEGKTYDSVYNNLGVIYENFYNDLNKAKEFYTKAFEVNSNSQKATQNLERINNSIKEIKEKPKKLKDIYFKKTMPWHKKILFAIYKLSNQDTVKINDLYEATKQTEYDFKKNIDFLKKLNLIIVNDENITLDPAIEQVIRDYVDPKLERQIIKVDNSKLYRPIFYHESEILMYRALMELFPQHLVFPNISLKTLFDIDKMKELISIEDLKYLFMAHVDYAIINTSNYFPVLAFEKDSDYNDTDYAKDKADIKNMIFRTGGIPLIRMRFNGSMDYEKLKSEIKNATKSLINECSKDNTYEVDFNKEFDVKRFGIVSSPIDLEILNSDWEGMVGRGTSQKSKIIDIENGKLIIEISIELKPIIGLSEDIIKNKFINKYEVIKEVEFTWY